VNVDGIEERPRLGLKTQEQGGAKVDSAGAKILGKTPCLSLSSHRFAFLPPISHLITLLLSFLSLFLLLDPAGGDLANSAGGELLVDFRLCNFLPAFLLPFSLSLFLSLLLLLDPAVVDLANGAGGEPDSRFCNCLPASFLTSFLSFPLSVVRPGRCRSGERRRR
jgi:hypothetical protein